MTQDVLLADLKDLELQDSTATSTLPKKGLLTLIKIVSRNDLMKIVDSV